ncbi:MAG: Druantia anti-phage system protein DruA, partial [Candidatus Brocadiales bacterium]
MREVKPDSFEEILFRWWNLVWWSIPYQHPYGRQMRFLLWDTTHNAPFGLIGLQSPVLKMAVRDNSLGISRNELD